MCRTVTPSVVSTTGGWVEAVARVKMSTSIPRWASRLDSSIT